MGGLLLRIKGEMIMAEEKKLVEAITSMDVDFAQSMDLASS